MPVVKMPDGALVEMPDNPTPEQLQQLDAVNGTLAETGRVLDKGLRGGLAATPGVIGDVALTGIKNLHKGFDLFPNIPADVPMMPGMQVIRFLSELGKTKPVQGSKFGDVTGTLATAGGMLPPVSQPQTELGKATANVLEPTVATVAGGGVGTPVQKAVVGAAGGAGGELASRVLGDNVLTRFLGSLFGGGLAGGAQALKPNSEKLVRQATEHVTDQDWQKAQALEKVLEASNIPHAKSQLLGPRSTLDDVVATASANPSVRPKIITATEGAPKASEEALNVWTNRNLPPPGPGSRSEVLASVQDIAEQALQKLKDKSNTDFAKAMPPKGIEYDQGRVKTLYNSLRQLADDPRFGATSEAGKALQRFAERLVESREWDLSGVNPTVRLRAEQAAKEAGVALDPSQIPGARQVTTFVTNAHKINNLNKEAKLMSATDDFKGLPIGDIRRIMNQATPEFNPARDAKRAVMEGEYNPAAQGLTGQIAQMGGGTKPDKLTARDTALATVFNPTQPQSAAIRDMAKTMGGEQVGELLREHIQRTMQTVLRTDEKSPRSFVKALYESPAQKENIDAALEVVARTNKQNPDALKIGFRRLMEALDSFKDLKLASGVSPATTAAQAGQNVVSQAATPLTGTRRYFEQRVTAESYNKIADLVIQPDGLKRLAAIAKSPNQETLRQMALSVMTATQSGEQRD